MRSRRSACGARRGAGAPAEGERQVDVKRQPRAHRPPSRGGVGAVTGRGGGNKFSIVLRDVAIDDEAHTSETPPVEAACAAAAAAVATNGFVNYFGLQRLAATPGCRRTPSARRAAARLDGRTAPHPRATAPSRRRRRARRSRPSPRIATRAPTCACCRRNVRRHDSSSEPTSTRGGAPPRTSTRRRRRRWRRRRRCGRCRGGSCSLRERTAGAAVESDGVGAAVTAGRGRRRGRPRVGGAAAAAAERGGCEEEEEEGVADDADGPAAGGGQSAAPLPPPARAALRAASGKWVSTTCWSRCPATPSPPPRRPSRRRSRRARTASTAPTAFGGGGHLRPPWHYRPLLAHLAATAKCVAYDDHTLPLLASDLDAIDGERRPAGSGGVAGATPRTALVLEFAAGVSVRNDVAARAVGPPARPRRAEAEVERRWRGRRLAGGVARHRRRDSRILEWSTR